jgi:hypothetical protein
MPAPASSACRVARFTVTIVFMSAPVSLRFFAAWLRTLKNALCENPVSQQQFGTLQCLCRKRQVFAGIRIHECGQMYRFMGIPGAESMSI